jgi:acyl-CoA dehydrogenase
MLKVQATRMLESVAREAAQVLGGASFIRGSKVERIYREVRVNAIGGGSEEIMLDLAGRQLFGR